MYLRVLVLVYEAALASEAKILFREVFERDEQPKNMPLNSVPLLVSNCGIVVRLEHSENI